MPQVDLASPTPHVAGHYLGHWLSATAMVVEATGDAAVKAKHDAMVATLGAVQDKWGTVGLNGYLFPYSIVAWDNLCVFLHAA